VETPTEEISSPQSESSEGTGLEFEEADFGAITDFVELDGEEPPPVEPQAEAVETPAEETPPEEPPVEEVSASEAKPEVEEEVPTEVVAEAEETPPEPVVEPEPEVTKVPTQEELKGMYDEHRAKTLPELEKLFTLSDEQAAALDEQPSKIIPQLAGQMMYDTMLSTYNAVMSALPTVVGTYLAASTTAEKAQGQFFDRWPDLQKPQASKVVSAAIQAYRSANPRAPLDDVIQGAGVMAMINLGLDPMKKAEPEISPAKPKPRPPKPAAPRGQTPIPPKPSGESEGNFFSDLAEVFDQDN